VSVNRAMRFTDNELRDAAFADGYAQPRNDAADDDQFASISAQLPTRRLAMKQQRQRLAAAQAFFTM
jgi:hypothetical protein